MYKNMENNPRSVWKKERNRIDNRSGRQWSTCWVSTWSALFRTTRILSSWPRKDEITRLNSSLTSSLCGSNKRRIRSHLEANHEVTPVKSYARWVLCFSPDKTPGVSTNVTCSSSLNKDEWINNYQQINTGKYNEQSPVRSMRLNIQGEASESIQTLTKRQSQKL